MNKGLPPAAISTKAFRAASWLIDAEPFSRRVVESGSPDDMRLKAALKRAVESDLAPQTLIDSIRNKIRNADEPR